MRSTLSTLAVERPRDLAHALRLMHADGARPTPIAGGTDLLVYLNAGALDVSRFIDLWGLRELRGIRAGRDGVTLGATTTFTEIREHPLVGRRFPALVAAASEVGARQIQNRATVAGNVANGSPAGDSLPVLLALDAVVHVRSVRGERAIPFNELYRGYRELALEPDELIVSAALPFPPAASRQFFRKVGTRRAQSISKVVMCGVFGVARDRTVAHARLAFGSVAPTPVRAVRAERALLGRVPDAATVAAARAALTSDIAPIDDIRSEREYRMDVAGNVLEQCLRTIGARAPSRAR